MKFNAILRSKYEVKISKALSKCKMSEIEYEMSEIEKLLSAIDDIFAGQ